ncbi:MAG: TRAM domain-containing protein, partial [Halomonas sp.]|nr:TRAM domain-containing protein [Halomonas sp.]
MAMLGKRRPVRRPVVKEGGASGMNAPTPERTGEAGLDILRLAHDGRGVARDAVGKTVFVEQALPGERVSVGVHRSRKRFDEAHVREWLVRSPQRIEPPCPHYAQCGGCSLQHLALPAQRGHKRDVLVEQLARQGLALDAPPVLLAGEGWGYRRRARIGVKLDAQGVVHLGFRARGSHHLVDIERCPVLVPELEALLPSLRHCLEGLEAPRHVGHVELAASEGDIAVVVRQLRTHAADTRAWLAWAETHRVVLGLLEGRESPVLRWVGKSPRLSYTLKSGAHRLALAFEPGDFLQVNAEINQALVTTALDWLQPQPTQRVLDLFAGVGNFSL